MRKDGDDHRKSGLSIPGHQPQQGKDVVVKRLQQLTNMVLDDLVDNSQLTWYPRDALSGEALKVITGLGMQHFRISTTGARP